MFQKRNERIRRWNEGTPQPSGDKRNRVGDLELFAQMGINPDRSHA